MLFLPLFFGFLGLHFYDNGSDLKGAKSEPVEGFTENVTRYKKNEKYIDIDFDGNIISFGLLE